MDDDRRTTDGPRPEDGQWTTNYYNYYNYYYYYYYYYFYYYSCIPMCTILKMRRGSTNTVEPKERIH
ncbi:hypothetical protein DPMN_026602 [Dreissena polymorpha]|uniref:Uncharacterized protein n=1 Tax=Dreissena polymorpha TaxID=45954 RepID=A0A9D4LTR5_DREPO|nr:hypothetical protein DPMN_026602 [Dreissena polymorpha]